MWFLLSTFIHYVVHTWECRARGWPQVSGLSFHPVGLGIRFWLLDSTASVFYPLNLLSARPLCFLLGLFINILSLVAVQWLCFFLLEATLFFFFLQSVWLPSKKKSDFLHLKSMPGFSPACFPMDQKPLVFLKLIRCPPWFSYNLARMFTMTLENA